jgi:small GTP-binding protein
MNARTRVLTVGAQSAGKTELLGRISGEFQIMAPTIGCRLESLDTGSIIFTCLDMGSHEKLQPVWEHIYRDADAVLLVVDSNDRGRLEHVGRYLAYILSQRSLNGCRLIIAANKQDLPGALNDDELADYLDLHSIRDRYWTVVQVSAKSGRGVEALMQEFDSDEARDYSDEMKFAGSMHTTSLKSGRTVRSLLKSQSFQQTFNAAKVLPKGFAFTGLAF